jgi:hypothetical protein
VPAPSYTLWFAHVKVHDTFHIELLAGWSPPVANIPKMKAKTSLRLLLGLLFWECTDLVALPDRWTSYIPPKYTYMEQVDKSVLTALMTCIPSLSKTTSYLVWSCTDWKTLFCLLGVISFTTQKKYILYILIILLHGFLRWSRKWKEEFKNKKMTLNS